MNEKHKRFVAEYLIDMNATQAAIRTGYSKRTAKAQGSFLLTNPDIAAAVKAGQTKALNSLSVTKERIVAELAKIAFADIRKAVVWGRNPLEPDDTGLEPNGLNIYPVDLVPSSKIDDDTAAAISEVSLTQTGVRIKMHDKKSALVDLGKHLGMFVERHEHSGSFEVVSKDQRDAAVAAAALADS